MKKVLILMMILIVLTGCKKQKPDEPIIEPPVVEEPDGDEDDIDEEVDLHIGQVRSQLTGLWIPEELGQVRPIGIMINNLKAALPQDGLSRAEIMYETLAEGGITRLFGIFQDYDAEKIGPVRSGRHYYLYFALDHDAVYLHYGQSPQTLPEVAKLKMDNLNGLSYLDTIMCFRDNTRKAPHNAYTSKAGIEAALEKTNIRSDVDKELVSKLKFYEDEQTLVSDINANKVILHFVSGSSKHWFDYDVDKKIYLRSQYEEPHIDNTTKEQLAFKNIIVQYANMWQIPGDSEGRLDAEYVGSGTGQYITNGKAIDITWKKESAHAPTQYFDKDNKELLLNPGKTWIAVMPLNRGITLE